MCLIPKKRFKKSEVSVYLISALVVVIPLFEASKNILLVSILAFSLYSLLDQSCVSKQSFLKRKVSWGWMCLVFSAFFAGFTHEYGGDLDSLQWVMYPLLGLVISNLTLSLTQIRTLMLLIVTSSALALYDATPFVESDFQLRSVGYVTQSCIYLTVASVASFFFLIDESSSIAEVATSAVVLAFSLIFMMQASQLVGLLGIFFVTTFTLTSFLKSSTFHSRFLMVIVGILLSGFGALYLDREVLLEAAIFNSTRAILDAEYLLKIAFEHFDDSRIFFGVGMGDFELLFDLNRDGLISDAESAVPAVFKNHGHGLFTTVMVERGLLGVSFFMAGTLIISIQIVKIALVAKKEIKYLAIVSLTLIMMNLVLGLVQTTFHLEHGLLSYIIVGLSMSSILRGTRLVDTPDKPRLSIYTFGGKNVPSTRFRVIQYVEILRSYFSVTIHHSSPGFLQLVGRKDEVIFLQKRLLGLHVLLLAKTFKRSKWVYDFDDAIWTFSSQRWSIWTTFRTRLRFFLMTRIVDQVHTSSNFLRQRVPRSISRVVPVSVPSVREQDESEDSGRLVLGWAGKESSLYQLQSVLKLVSPRIFEKVDFVILSGVDPELDVRYRFIPFSLINEHRFFSTVDVGLVPSTTSMFDLGKTPVKALQHFSFGKTIISNPVGAGREFITRETAIIVENDNWNAAFESLVAGRIDLVRLKRNAFLIQSMRYNSQVTSGRLLEHLSSLVSEEAQNGIS